MGHSRAATPPPVSWPPRVESPPSPLPFVGAAPPPACCGAAPPPEAVPAPPALLARVATAASRYGIGSIGTALRRSSKCRCGPVECPAEPPQPSVAPPVTLWPAQTARRDMAADQVACPSGGRTTPSGP